MRGFSEHAIVYPLRKKRISPEKNSMIASPTPLKGMHIICTYTYIYIYMTAYADIRVYGGILGYVPLSEKFPPPPNYSTLPEEVPSGRAGVQGWVYY